MESTLPTQWINLRFTHPKIIDKTIKVQPTDVLGQLRQVVGQSTLLYLFNNYHFQQKNQRIPELYPIVDCLATDQPIDIVLDSYNEVTAKHHFSTVAHILANPNIYTFIINTHKGVEMNYEVPAKQCLQIETLDFDEIINGNFSNIFLKSQTQSMADNFLGFMCLSGFNPPPGNQRLNGDLFYIHIRTLQCNDYHVTASPRGFFVNQSKISHYNPNMSNSHKGIYVSLIDLLRSISDKFKNNLDNYVNEKKISETQFFKVHSFHRTNCSRWLQNLPTEHTWNSKKLIEFDIKTDKIGTKDWNELFQLKNSPSFGPKVDTYYKYKFFSKLYSQFEQATIQGAKALVDGKIPPLNPMDQTKKHIYIYDNIFYSIANQTPFNHSQQKGQDATPSASAINIDLINLSILQELNIPDLNVLHMIVISYRGFRVIAQCIIPGILTGDHSNCSQYGSIDDGKTIETNVEFEKLMIQVCEKLNLEDTIRVNDGEGVEKRIACSPDIKGILGSDKRKYILDLLRLSPRDLNYLGPDNEVCVVRPELIQAFMQTKQNKQIPKINTNIGTQIKFISNQTTQKQLQLLEEIAKYITHSAVPQLIQSLKTTYNSYLTDSNGISTVFHKFGVNIRYLGYVCMHEMLKDNKDIQTVLIRVMVVRSLKHLFRMAMRQTNILYMNETLVNLLNGIFGNKYHVNMMEEGINAVNGSVDQNDAKKKKKKKSKMQKIEITDLSQNIQNSPIKVSISAYLSMKPSELWAIVKKVCKCRYNFDLQDSVLQLSLFKLPCQKLATLRDVCLSVGLRLEKKRYNIVDQSNSDKQLPFQSTNIIEISAIPRKKDFCPPAITHLIKEADTHSDKYQMKQALHKYNQANDELINLTGGLILELAHVRSKMGKIFYLLGEQDSAISTENNALEIIEALESEDSPKAVQSYSTLGLYYSVKGEKEKAFYYIYKSINLMLISFGETHPDFLINVSNLARILHQNHEYKKASQLYGKVISIISTINGKDHLKVSFCYSAQASLHFEIGEFKKAIEYQNQSINILKKVLPENDVRLNDGIKILKLYKEVNENGKNMMGKINPILQNNSTQKKEEEKQDKKKKQPKK